MLSKKEIALLQRQFRNYLTARNARLYFKDEDLVLDLSLQIGEGVGGVFYFNRAEFADLQSFVKALANKACEYDPIDEALFVFDWRRKEFGDDEARERLRSDLENANVVSEVLTQIALVADRIYLGTRTTKELLGR